MAGFVKYQVPNMVNLVAIPVKEIRYKTGLLSVYLQLLRAINQETRGNKLRDAYRDYNGTF